MKKLSILLFVLFSITSNNFCLFNISSFAQATDDTVYAKVKNECILYKTSDTSLDTFENIYFEVPCGYFVTVIGEITQTISKVNYAGFIGFVKTEKIFKVSGEPHVKTLTGITFSINQSSGTQIRETPTTEISSNIKNVIQSGTSNISYIAKTYGEVPPSGKSNVWYFAEYSPSSDPVSVYFGYVYSEKTENLSSIPENNEFEQELLPAEQTVLTTQENYIYLSGGLRAVMIIIISLPMLVIFLLLVFSGRKKKHGLATAESYANNHFIRKKPQNLQENCEKQPKFPTYDFDDDDLL